MFLIFHYGKIIVYFTEVKMDQNSSLDIIVKGISIPSQTVLRKMGGKHTSGATLKISFSFEEIT